MKKSRIIPSILLLLLCVGILGVGIYAAIPTSTSIEGTLTIIAPSRELDISGVVTGAKENASLSTDSIHDVTTWDLSTLTFDLSDKIDIAEVEDIEITVHIKNKSMFEYGAYFYKQGAELDAKGNATINSFEDLNTSIVNSDSVKLADVTLTDYTHIMPNDDNKTNTSLDEIDMTITLSLAEFFIDAPKPQGFKYILRIESYQPNFTTDGAYTGSEEFVKVSSTISSNTSSVKGLGATPLASKATRTSIPASAFAGTAETPNTTLKKIIMPKTIDTIGSNAFNYCTELEEFNIQTHVKNMGASVFAGCSGLKSITSPFVGANKSEHSMIFSNPHLGYLFGSTEYAGSTVASGISTGLFGTTSYYIPTSLKTVIVNGETYIGSFQNCSTIEKIEIINVDNFGLITTDGCTALTGIFYNGSVDEWSKVNVTEISLSEQIKLYCNNVEVKGNITISSNTLGVNFAYCTGITSINMPELTTIAASAFSGLTNLSSVYMPKVVSIGASAFGGCSGLTSIALPNTISSIGASAFGGCTALMRVDYNGTLTEWLNVTLGPNGSPLSYLSLDRVGTFYTTEGLVAGEVSFPEGTTTIETHYAGCSGITKINIPESVTTIRASSFRNCKGLTSVVIPGTVTSIGGEAFSGCGAIAEMTIPFTGAANTEETSSRDEYKNHFGYIFGNIQYFGSYECIVTNGYGSVIATYYLPTILKKITYTGDRLKSLAFRNCSGIVELSFINPLGMVHYGSDGRMGALEGCTSLEKLGLHYGVGLDYRSYLDMFSVSLAGYSDDYYYTVDNSYLFEQYHKIPKSLKTLEIYNETIYCSLSGLTSVEILSLPNAIELSGATESVFKGLTSLKTINAPMLEKISEEVAFIGCTSLTQVNMPRLKEASRGAFKGCSSLEEIELPELTIMMDGFFTNCTSLRRIVISNKFINLYRLDEIGVWYGYQLENCSDALTVEFTGTLDEFKAITNYDYFSSNFRVKINGVTYQPGEIQ